MPRLIAIEGPEAGLALPVGGQETVLAVGADRRLKLSRPPEPRPPAGAAIRRASDQAYTIARFAAPGADAGPSLAVNGETVERAALHHGDLVSFAGITLIFDCDDVGRADTAAAPPGEALRRVAPPRRPTTPAPEPAGHAGAPPGRKTEPTRRFVPQSFAGAGGGSKRAPPPPRPTPPPSTSATGSLDAPDAPEPGMGDSIVLRRKAYRDADALLAALDEQEAALRGAPAPPRAPAGAPPKDEFSAFRAGYRDSTAPGPSGRPEAERSGAPAAGGAEGSRDRLTFLLKVATAVGGTLDLNALLARLLDIVFEEVPADRGTILLVDKAAKKLRSMAGKRRGARPGEPAHVRISRTIVKEALASQESILTVDALADERFQMKESVAAAGIRSAMCVPIVREGRPLGVIHLDTGERGANAFSRDDLDLLSAVASIASLAIENARLYQEAAERERLRAELTIASTIQQRLLPKTAPRAGALDVFGRTIPAKELGGDIFDFIEDPAGATLHVLVGDVSGKGIGAGIIMAMARSYIRPLASAYVSPREVLIRASRLLYDDTARDMFMSAVLMLWDERARRLSYCGAGQEHILIVRAGSERCEAFPAGGIALMMVDDPETYLEEKELPLASGDLVVLYSDGVIDARDPAGTFYGLERLTASLPAIARLGSAEAVVERVCADVTAHTGRAEQHDDVTVVALRKR